MNKKDLFTISYPTGNEKKLKLFLNNTIAEYGITKTYNYLVFRNKLLLNSCNIDCNEFNHILFRNYIYILNNNSNFNFRKLSDMDKNTIEAFNNCINNNNFTEALELYSDSFLIHELLCYSYIINLQKNELDKINSISDAKANELYNKISILNNTDLTIKGKAPKKVKNYSNYVSNR